MMWLAQDQTPSYKTINRFRVNPNTDALIESLFSIQNHESKLNENSKALYRDLVEEKIIPEIKEDGDSDLTTKEIDLIGTHLDK